MIGAIWNAARKTNPGTRNLSGRVCFERYTQSTNAVTITSAASAGHLPRSARMNAAHAASALDSDSRTILTVSPTEPEKAAIARALHAGRNEGAAGRGAGAVSA